MESVQQTRTKSCNKKTGLKVLQSRNARNILQKINWYNEHFIAFKLEQLVKQSYDVQGTQPINREVVYNSEFCSNQIDQGVLPVL